MENGKRELGKIEATLASLKEDVERLEEKVDVICGQLPEHGSRLGHHAEQLHALRTWKEALFGKVIAMIGAAGTIGAAIAWFFTRTG